MRVYTAAGVIVVIAIAIAACTAPGASDSLAPTSTPWAPNATSAAATASAHTLGEMEVTGRLAADSTEGGCAYLEASDGTRYEVVYPAGWTLRSSPLSLADPSGTIVARAGDTVTVRGTITTEMASTCQIGPILKAATVVPAGS